MDIHAELPELPKARGWAKSGAFFSLYQGCWLNSNFLPDVITIQRQFRAQEKDIIFASHPKCGTTWLKSLLFSLVNRHIFTPTDTPLLTQNAHQLVPTLELLRLTHGAFSLDPCRDLISTRSVAVQRLYATHVPYGLLPECLARERSSDCRVVYVCRNPLDTIVSFWKFISSNPDNVRPDWTLEECVETFCKGESGFGPFWDHVLGFWKASLEKPEEVLFLRYEDMLEDTHSEVKKIAEFLGVPFSEAEEINGAVEQIVELCSFKKMKELDVNKHGKASNKHLKFKRYFRKGEVGDWVNHLSPSMVENIKKVVEEKLKDSGLTFTYSS